MTKCACGCGEDLPSHYTKWQHLKGHKDKKRPRLHKPCKHCGGRDLPIRGGLCGVCRLDPRANPLIECACGCGQTIRKYHPKTGKEQHCLPNHPPNKSPLSHKDISRATLHKLYYEELLSMQEIANRLGTHVRYIERLMDKYELPRRGYGEAAWAKHHDAPHPTKERLEALYNSGMSLKDMGEELGVYWTHVREWLVKYGIPRRTKKEAAKLAYEQGKCKRQYTPLVTQTKLREVASKPNMTLTAVAQELGISYDAARRCLEAYRIPWPQCKVCDNCKKTFVPRIHKQRYCCPRCRRMADQVGQTRPRIRGDSLPTVYCAICGREVEGMTPPRYCGNKLGVFFCCRNCMGEWFSEHFAGEDHPLWEGGKSRKGYGTKYWEQQRAKALKRDSYACQRCGTTQEELNTIPLQVHHKIPSRLFKPRRKAHALKNLITFCPRCHGIVEQYTQASWKGRAGHDIRSAGFFSLVGQLPLWEAAVAA